MGYFPEAQPQLVLPARQEHEEQASDHPKVQ